MKDGGGSSKLGDHARVQKAHFPVHKEMGGGGVRRKQADKLMFWLKDNATTTHDDSTTRRLDSSRDRQARWIRFEMQLVLLSAHWAKGRCRRRERQTLLSQPRLRNLSQGPTDSRSSI